LLLVIGLLLVPATAFATPQPLPFSYVYETLPKGSLEVETYVDYDPIKVKDVNGNPVTYGATQFQTEFEYGITDRLELGLYATIAPSSGETAVYTDIPALTEGTGLKERLRLRFAEAGEWPVDVGIYGELVETEREVELEAKILLQRRIGDLRLVANLWGEREYENLSIHQGDWVVNPTLGATYQVTPLFHPGVESWLHAEFPDSNPPSVFNNRPQVYVGPTMMFDFGNFWFTLGAYWRVTETTHALLDSDPGNGAPADAFSPFWLRMVVGLSF
jgi:hypothetical protein